MFPESHIQGRTRSAWAAHAPALGIAEPLPHSTNADVCIIGGGIAGLSTAYHLCRAGSNVVLVDRIGIGAGETARTTAHLTALLDYRYHELEAMHGKDGARVAAESHVAAIASIERIVREENIDCDFRRLDGYLFEPPGASDRMLKKEERAANAAGVGCELVTTCPLPFATGPALRVPAQAEVHPLKYLAGLAGAVEALGGRIHKAHVRGVEEGDSVTITTTSGERIVARSCVVATNTPINDRFAMHTKQAPYRTYVLGILVPSGTLPAGLFWDTDDPYHYVRAVPAASLGLAESGDVLIVGGEDHKVGQDPECPERWTRLERWTRERIASTGPVVFHWSGQVQEPADGLGFVGANPGSENVFIATGHSGNGITYGALSGLLLSDLVLGRSNAWQEVFAPSRKPSKVRSVVRFARENLNVAKRYTDRLRAGDVKFVKEIPRGEGRILRSHGKLLAVYVDEGGIAHERSAVCPHLGCVVSWNAAERSWDCPCHGSRFEATGEVLIGPAPRGLDAPGKEEAPRERPGEEPRQRPGVWLEPGKLP